MFFRQKTYQVSQTWSGRNSNGFVLLGREVPEVRAGTGRVLRAVCRFQVLQYSRMPSGQETCLLALLEELLNLIRWAEDPHFPPEAVPFQAVAKLKTLQKLLQLTLLVFMEANAFFPPCSLWPWLHECSPLPKYQVRESWT
ncbi:MAG: hypothetical protein KGY41_06180 [Desulfovermiculus sp.]|nr:hypothetical protein [Desulfovermiculus sp.]